MSALLSRRDAGRVDVTEFPGQQNADKKQYRKAYPQGQRQCHFVAPGFSLRIIVFLHHEEQGCTQAADDGDKCKNDQVFHGPDYLVSLRWKFWLITLSALLAVAATLALGRWQLSRAAQKEALQSSYSVRAGLPKLDGQALSTRVDMSTEQYRGVTLRGHWIAQRTVFLDNRQMDGKVGLYVVTPMQIEGSAAVVLVQRGWVARNFLDRTGLPQIETPTGVVEIQGRIAPPPAKLYELGNPQTGLIRQNLDMLQFGAESGLPLLAFSVQQTGVASGGLLREWPLVGTGIEKHYGYAFQWFALSALIAILYVWFQIVRRFIDPRRA